MADEQKTLSGQINSLATRVAQEIKELKNSVGTGVTGTVKTINGNGPDSNGNVTLTAAGVSAVSTSGGTISGSLTISNTLAADTIKLGGADITEKFVLKDGDRGAPAGYQTLFWHSDGSVSSNSEWTVSKDIKDMCRISDPVLNVPNGNAHECWLKVVNWRHGNTSMDSYKRVKLGTNWRWNGGTAPVLSDGMWCVFLWSGSLGVVVGIA